MALGEHLLISLSVHYRLGYLLYSFRILYILAITIFLLHTRDSNKIHAKCILWKAHAKISKFFVPKSTSFNFPSIFWSTFAQHAWLYCHPLSAILLHYLNSFSEFSSSASFPNCPHKLRMDYTEAKNLKLHPRFQSGS